MNPCVESVITNTERKPVKRCSNVGGQALIEGVMMRADERVAIAIRQPDGSIRTTEEIVRPTQNKWWKLPILRGIYALYKSMSIGVRALNQSAEVFGQDEETAFEQWLKKRFPKQADSITLSLTLLTSLLLAIVFFMALPTLLTGFFKSLVTQPVVLSLIEGLIKMSLFVLYIFLISRLKDIKRVFQYHGAEHKSVFNYESGLALTLENAKRFPRLHPRCGTSYLFFVLALSIVVFSFVSWTNLWVRILLKVLFLPVVAGLGYELLKFTAKENALVRILRQPGLWLQRITTAEPDDGQIEIALTALRLAVQDDRSTSPEIS